MGGYVEKGGEGYVWCIYFFPISLRQDSYSHKKKQKKMALAIV